MEVSTQAAAPGERTVLVVAGEVDLQTAPELRERLDALTADGVVDLVIDLSAVTFVDSSALGALVAVHQGLEAAGGGLRIAAPRPHVQKVFAISRLDEVVPLFETVAAAQG